jgi:hypothetical protein
MSVSLCRAARFVSTLSMVILALRLRRATAPSSQSGAIWDLRIRIGHYHHLGSTLRPLHSPDQTDL